MSANTNGNVFIGYAGLLLLAAVICAPVNGVTGLLGALVAIYFGLVFVNGADNAANRRKRRIKK